MFVNFLIYLPIHLSMYLLTVELFLYLYFFKLKINKYIFTPSSKVSRISGSIVVENGKRLSLLFIAVPVKFLFPKARRKFGLFADRRSIPQRSLHDVWTVIFSKQSTLLLQTCLPSARLWECISTGPENGLKRIGTRDKILVNSKLPSQQPIA